MLADFYFDLAVTQLEVTEFYTAFFGPRIIWLDFVFIQLRLNHYTTLFVLCITFVVVITVFHDMLLLRDCLCIVLNSLHVVHFCLRLSTDLWI